MPDFVLFDTENENYVRMPFGDPKKFDVPGAEHCCTPHDARRWGSLKAASQRGAQMNWPRQIPHGVPTPELYADRPYVEVHELSEDGDVLRTHICPPVAKQ